MSNLVREKVEAYFSSLNSTSSRMMADIINSRKEHGAEWDNFDSEKQSEILWRSIVKTDALIKYNDLPSESVDVEYFPVLRTKSGEKIIVDEDATAGRSFGCSWRDEHSAPFRWETQSQLELRIFESDETDKDTTDVVKPVEVETPVETSVETSVEPAIESEDDKLETKKDDEIKRPSILKRPEVPPPPVPPHIAVPPVPAHVEVPVVPPHSKKSDTVIYAKVVKRKSSASAKTLLISELKAHRRAKEEMKPAVPPRMSLELKNLDLTQFGDPTDADGIPKTGFDFLDNW